MPDSHELLVELINNMEKNLSGKLDGVHARLDVLNGRVYKHEVEKANKKELEDISKHVAKLDTKVWKILLFITAGAAGGAGTVEVVKAIFGG